MPNLIAEQLPDLEAHALPDLGLGEGFLLPRYDGQSILNIPDSVCRWLDIPTLGAGPLVPEIHDPLGNGIRRVILILMDALALHRFQAWLEAETAPVWNRLTRGGLLAPLTSIAPSTTSSAITTLWTGQSPAVHGIVGYEVWLKEYGIVANMILHSPMTFRDGVGSLEKAGFDAKEFLTTPTLGPHLRAHGVTPYAFQHYSIARSGLSEMFIRETEIYPFSTPADLWVSMRQLLENKPGERMFIWTYWGQVDGLSHHHHPDDERVAAEFSHFSAAFEEFFLDRIGSSGRRDTLVILTADHGQINTPQKPDYLLLENHPDLNAMLHMRPTGENRLISLFPRSGQLQAVKDYFDTVWPEQFVYFSAKQAVESGLFGPGPAHPRLRDRLGDLIAAARGDAYLWWGDKENRLYGRHGGLHSDEMLVPFLAVRL
jgi:hypothetical protein